MRKLLFVLFLLCSSLLSRSWGFFAHEQINYHAVFTLPPEMIGFYKHHITFLTEKSTAPDKRRYVIPEEAPKHYIDLEHYGGDTTLKQIPKYWAEAVEKYTEDSLHAFGIVPYHIFRVANQLIYAFKNREEEKILKLSADLGHYIADANVPLHTTFNYNGQHTDQLGIHGLWETKLPSLFFENYDMLVGKCVYIEDLQAAAWKAVEIAHLAVDTVLKQEKLLSKQFLNSPRKGFEQRGSSIVKGYSNEYAKAYHKTLHGMVERQMRRSIKMLGDFWCSCWVKAGQPKLDF